MDFVPAGADCHIDDLPDEIFFQILNFVPIKQVIRCSTVSKRWEAACRYSFRTRGSLVIGDDDWRHTLSGYPPPVIVWGCHWERPSQQMDDILLTNKSLVSAMMTNLNQMVGLRRLCVNTPDVIPADMSLFIRKFADRLTMLEIDFAVSMIGADVFPHLTRLRCRHFDADSSAAFPKLTELLILGVRLKARTYFRLDCIEKLPNMRLPRLKKLLISGENLSKRYSDLVEKFIDANADNLTSLKMIKFILRLNHAVVFPNLTELYCGYGHFSDAGYAFPALAHLTIVGSVTADFLSSLPADQMLSLKVSPYGVIEDLVPAISRMRNLKSLTFTWRGLDPNETLSSVFDNMHHLRRVELDFRDCRCEIDEMIATLVNQNSNLSCVYLRKGFTDIAVTSLAQLQHLTHVSLCLGGNLTAAAALTLLRGASRNVIRQFIVYNINVGRHPVTREIRLMCEERNTTFKANMTTYYVKYEIHI